MEFLYLLERIRVPILNEFMLLITQLGEETAFLVVALVLFWCVDKRKGYYILGVGFLGTLANQFMKLWFRIPRPWILDENFTMLEQAREAASGYSFPSGHTQSAVGTFGCIAYTTKNKWVRFFAIMIAVLVPFSRMYIGVHTPQDVLVAAAMALILIFVLRPVIFGDGGKHIPVLLCIMACFAVAFLCFVEFYAFPHDIDAHNLASGIKNAYTLLGAMLGMCVVYIVDKKWINFSVNAVWWAQVLKVVLGLVLVLIVKSGTKTLLNMLFGESIGRAVRYFAVVIVAGVVWPLSFRWFGNLKTKEK
jgi:membrane-associated phospholipid phosphatase